MDIEKQKGGDDFRLFAIVVLTALANWQTRVIYTFEREMVSFTSLFGHYRVS